MKFAAIFSIIVGLGMVAQWAISYFSRQIPEVKTEPIRIGFHIAAEMVTAASLLASGIGLLLNTPWSVSCFLVASGMLLYTSIVSPGYFAQQGKWIWLGMFGFLIILALISLALVF
jgi:hypothetical protein